VVRLFSAAYGGKSRGGLSALYGTPLPHLIITLPALSVEAIMSSALTQGDVAAFEKRAAEAEARLDALESGSGAGARAPPVFLQCALARMCAGR